jgi:signal transduction histidine kinase/CheY-like chemotaxis protein
MTGRWDEIADLLLALAGGRFDARGVPSPHADESDAVLVAVNLLAETLQAEHAARSRAEASLRDALDAWEHAPAMFCSLDPATLAVIACNATLARSLGRPRESILGADPTGFHRADGRPAFREALRAAAAGAPVPAGDYVLEGAGGAELPVVLSGSLYAGAEGEAPRVRVVMQDMSAVRALELKLRRAQQLESMGRLAAGVAHDFNNVLAVVLGSVSLAQSRTTDPELLEDLAAIEASAERGADLTRHILALGRREASSQRSVDVRGVVSRLEPVLRRILGQRTLTLALAPDLPPVAMEAVELEQLLLNTATNARDAMPGAGVLTIRTRAEPPRWVALEVSDTGHGIPPELLDRVFDPFVTTKGATGGSGLGLAVCRGVIDQIGGQVTVTSTRGAGTTFRFLLPTTAPQAVATSAPPAGASLLLVEDEAALRTLLARMLERAGYRVRSARDGVEGLEQALAHQPDLVVTDVRMPRLSGPDMVRRLRSARPDLPVVFVTGHAGTLLDDDLLTERSTRLLRKPFRPGELTEVVASVLAQATG